MLVDARYLLLVISVAVALNTCSLYRTWRRREKASWDGSERRVTALDVLISAAFCLAAVAACVHEWLR